MGCVTIQDPEVLSDVTVRSQAPLRFASRFTITMLNKQLLHIWRTQM
jgi:hypothetical protein